MINLFINRIFRAIKIDIDLYEEVEKDKSATIQAGTTAANVGLGNVNNTSDATVLAGNLTGNVTGNVGGVGVATVNGYGATAGGSQTAANTVSRMNNNGLVVIDGSGVKRVKIGNLSAL